MAFDYQSSRRAMPALRRGTFDKFANAALVVYIVLVPVLICGRVVVGYQDGMGAMGGPGSQPPPAPGWIVWLGTHPFADIDRTSHVGSLLDTCVWATVPACFAGSVAAGLHNGRQAASRSDFRSR